MRSGNSVGRTALILATAVFAVVWILTALFADSRLPAHFNSSGEVNRWDDKWSLLGPLAGVGVAMVVIFGGAEFIFRRMPARMINLPNHKRHAYWTAPENRAEFNRRFAGDMQAIGAAAVLLLAYVLAVCATAGGPVNVWVLAAPTVAFLVFVLGYIVYMSVGPRYRIPPEDRR